MKKIFFLVTIMIFAFTLNAIGQKQRKERTVNFRPEVGDEVLLTLRKKQVDSQTASQQKNAAKRKGRPFFDDGDALFGRRRQKPSTPKYANQETRFRSGIKKKRINSLTHDPEFEDWAQRKQKTKK